MSGVVRVLFGKMGVILVCSVGTTRQDFANEDELSGAVILEDSAPDLGFVTEPIPEPPRTIRGSVTGAFERQRVWEG